MGNIQWGQHPSAKGHVCRCPKASLPGVFGEHRGIELSSTLSVLTVKWVNESSMSLSLFSLGLNSKHLTIASKALSDLAPPTSQVSIATSPLPSHRHPFHLPPTPNATPTYQFLEQATPFSGPVPHTLCSALPRTLGQRNKMKRRCQT